MLRLAFRSLQTVSPTWAAALAERLFFTPPRSRLTQVMRAELERGKSFGVRVEALETASDPAQTAAEVARRCANVWRLA